jgi:hypothetical protein
MTVTFNKCAAQGDLLIRRIESLPDNVEAVNPEEGKHIVAHSETGHHHYVSANQDVTYFAVPNDPMVCYLKVGGEFVDLIHNRAYDTHETIRISNGLFELRRQREYTPEGWRRVED